MTFEGWYTIAAILLVMAALMTNRINIDVAMIGGLTLLFLGDAFSREVLGGGGVLSVTDGIKGFGHQALVIIGTLLIVAEGLKETGGMAAIAAKLLGRPKSLAGAQFRLMAPVAAMSAFMNNTPIVAMYVPIVIEWSRKLRISPSKFLIPLSFGTILGGKITYIGTASNIVVMSLYLKMFDNARTATTAAVPQRDDLVNNQWLTDLNVQPLSAAEQFWSIAWLGVPTTIAGVAFIMFASRWLLPDRKPAGSPPPDARQYEVEMEIQPESPIAGQTIEEAGLRQLPGLYLTQIERGEEVLVAVGPEERLQAGDRLGFVGILESVVDLRKIRGLVPATDQVQKISAHIGFRRLVEAVVSNRSPLVGKSVRESLFRTRYNAAIIAVHRNGQHIKQKIGDIVLQAGDTLLLETHQGFIDTFRNSSDFYLVSNVEGFRPIRHERAWVALAILGLLVFLFTFQPFGIHQVVAVLLCAMLMIGTRCVSGTVARRAVNWQILVVIGAALGFGEALTHTGAANEIAHGILGAAEALHFGPTMMLMAVFFIGALFAQFINPSGAAVLMFPVAMATARQLGVSPEPFVMVLMMSAGASFISPVAYQTNLLVYGPGGYSFADFVRIGVPLTIIVGIVSSLLAPLVFPFSS